MEYISITLQIILLTLIFAVPELFIERWMENKGFVRSNKIIVVLGVFLAVLIKVLWLESIPWWIWGIAVIVAPPLAGHRYDLWMTIKKGRWWWKIENDNVSH